MTGCVGRRGKRRAKDKPREPRTCHGCGASLEGAIVIVCSADGKTWCERCFDKDCEASE